MTDKEITTLYNKYANNTKAAHRHLYVCGKKDSYILKKDAIGVLKTYDSILRNYGCAVTSYLHEKQFTSNQEDWNHDPKCPLFTPNWKRPSGGGFFEHEDCHCDDSGLFIDLDIKQATGVKKITQDIVNKLAFEVTKLLYMVLGRVDGGNGSLVGPVLKFPSATLGHVRDTIVCYSSHRSNNSRGGSLASFDADYYKEGIHLMYPGLMLQRDTKRRVMAYLRGVAKDKNSDLYRFLESNIPNEFPDLIDGCYQYIDPVAATNMTIPYGSVKYAAGKVPSGCNYLKQTCNYFVFASSHLNGSKQKNIDSFDINKANKTDPIYKDALGRNDTRVYMFNYPISHLEKEYRNFNMTLELSLVYKEVDEDGDPTGLVAQVPFCIPDEVKNSDYFLSYTTEYKEKSFAVAEDIRTRRENKEAVELFEKTHIGYSEEVSEILENSPMQQCYNIVASLSRKRSSNYQDWYEVLIKLKQISNFYKKDADGYAIGKHFSKRHMRKLSRGSREGSENLDEGYYDEEYYTKMWNSLVVTVIDEVAKEVPINVYYSNYYSLLSLVKADNLEDYVSFCDSDFMENISKFIIKTRGSHTDRIPEIKKDYKINPLELSEIIDRYIRPFYKSGKVHGKKCWAEFNQTSSRWIVSESSAQEKIPTGIEIFVTKFIVDLINNISKKYLRCFDTQVGVLFNRFLPLIKERVNVIGYRAGVCVDEDDSDSEDCDYSEERSIPRIVGSAAGLGDDGDINIDEGELVGSKPKGDTRKRTPKKEPSTISIKSLAQHFRTYVIGRIGGVTGILGNDYKQLKLIFEEIRGKLMVEVSPEIASNYYSYITSVGTYKILTEDPSRYLKNMEHRLYSNLIDQEFFENRDSARLFVGVKNGVLELRHFEYPILHKGYHTFPISMQMGCEYKQFDPTDKYVIKVLKALKSMFVDGEHDAFDYLMRSSCLALDLSVHDTTYDFCYGGGSNGKSSYTGLMMKTFGEYYAETDVALITHGCTNKQAGRASPELLKLENKRFTLILEANHITLDDNILKKITGDGSLAGRGLHSNNDRSFTVKPKISITLNQIPSERGDDEGSRRRKRVIPFSRGFKKAGILLTDPSHVHADPEILKYCENGKYLTAFLSILTFYYANTTALCHERYVKNLRGKANEEARKAGYEDDEFDRESEKLFKESLEDYKHTPQDDFHIEVGGTGLTFPTIENATNDFQKNASPVYRFLSDRVFTLVNRESFASKAKPLVSPKMEATETHQALPSRPKLSENELIAYRGVFPTQNSEGTHTEFRVKVPDGNGNVFEFTQGKGDNYKINYVEDESNSDDEENLDTPEFPFQSFWKRYVDLDYIIDQYRTYNMAGGRQREISESFKQGFSTILNQFAVKGNDCRFEIIFISNEDYKSLSKIGHIVKQSKGAVKPLENNSTSTGTKVSFSVYIEKVTEVHKKFLRGLSDSESFADNTIECVVSQFGYSSSEKQIAAPIIAKKRVFNSINRLSGFEGINL